MLYINTKTTRKLGDMFEILLFYVLATSMFSLISKNK